MYRLSILCFLIAALFCNCSKEYKFTTAGSAKLSFSADSILFDTVFTSVGSVTQRLKVFNYNKYAVRVSEIKLNGGDASAYTLNIDGRPGNRLSNIDIRGNDSLSIFIKVSIDPDSDQNPFIVSDSISFLTNGNLQFVQLNAYGQNAHFLKDSVINENSLWDSKLPYVIYHSVRIPENKILTIAKGSRIYFHTGAGMQIDGTLIANGTNTDSIVFAGDRLERLYRDEPGQWVGMHFTGNSHDSKIDHSIIKNAFTGIQVDSLSLNGFPKLILANSAIKNMEITAYSGYKASFAAFNNLFFNCGQYLIYAVYGGNYDLKQNTFAEYNFPRQTAALFFTDYYPNSSKTSLLSVQLVNNIIWGSLQDELTFDKKSNSAISSDILTNLLKTKNSAWANTGNILNLDPQFVNSQFGIYQLYSGSPGMNTGTDLSSDAYYDSYLKTDKAGKLRIFPSESGCYEFQ